jgi:prepilin-type processing-associated H-X9-DG protein
MWKPRVIEIALALCAVLACVGIAVPMITRANDSADRIKCLDNLRIIGEAMRKWSELHDHALTPGRGMSGFCNTATGVPKKGSLYAVEPGLNALWDKGRGLITDPEIFRCPGDATLVPPPAIGEDFTDPNQLSYAMTGQLFPTDPPNKVVVADKSDKSLPGGATQNTGNHSHRFTNVLFVDGSVRTCDSPFLPSGVGSELGSIYVRESGERNDTYME